ncbi:MAG TPA: 1-acyl-sn-glycerol-3-phosphate acyltransferase [Puia sp.]|nr:1-acyl-sn-glycerol-3-phosphate acyltransferase [Puia sp.]
MYHLLRIYVWLGLKIYCPYLRLNRQDRLAEKGPLILAANHPNAILDAMIIGTLFREPIYFLSRGDVFSHPLISKVLSSLRLIPVYRLSEGKEYLRLNAKSFDRCDHEISKGAIVLIFAEGSCEHQWKLRPLKKGTARVALKAMFGEAPASGLRVLPVGLNYSSFDGPGKTVLVEFGSMISVADMGQEKPEAALMPEFNKLLTARLQACVLQSTANKKQIQAQIIHSGQKSLAVLKKQLEEPTADDRPPATSDSISIRNSETKSPARLFFCFMLSVPAAIGWALHSPLYYSVKAIVKPATKNTVYYDSVLFISLLVLYPVYWILILLAALKWPSNGLFILSVLLMPLLASAMVNFKRLFIPPA